MLECPEDIVKQLTLDIILEELFPTLFCKISYLIDIIPNDAQRLKHLKMLTDNIKSYLTKEIMPKNRREAETILLNVHKKIKLLDKKEIVVEQVILDLIIKKHEDTAELINRLKTYKNMPYNALFSNKFKFIAVNKILAVLNGKRKDIYFDENDVAALNDGRLGRIIDKFRHKEVLPVEFLNGEAKADEPKTSLYTRAAFGI